MFYVSVDVTKNKYDCYIVDSDRVVHAEYFVETNAMDWFELLYLTILDCITKDNYGNTRIGFEFTRYYSNNVTNYLCSNGFEVTTLNPLATNLVRKAQTLRKTKTNKVNARVIAVILFPDVTKCYFPVLYQITGLKSLT